MLGGHAGGVVPMGGQFPMNGMPGGEAMRIWLARPETQKSGNDGGKLIADKVLAAVSKGELQQSAVDDSVRRILRVMLDIARCSSGMLGTRATGAGGVPASTGPHFVSTGRRSRTPIPSGNRKCFT